jgi:hypothetical protein
MTLGLLVKAHKTAADLEDVGLVHRRDGGIQIRVVTADSHCLCELREPQGTSAVTSHMRALRATRPPNSCFTIACSIRS